MHSFLDSVGRFVNGNEQQLVAVEGSRLTTVAGKKKVMGQTTAISGKMRVAGTGGSGVVDLKATIDLDGAED